MAKGSFSKPELVIPQPKIENLRQHFFSERVIDKWNKLSEDTVSALSLNSFKGKLQRLYVDWSSTGFFKST